MTDTDSYLGSITGYYLENLPDALLASFVPQEKYSLRPDMMRAFSARLGIPGAARDGETGTMLIALASQIQAGLDAVGRKAFIRLGSRSPKDSLYKALPCGRARDVFDMFFFSKRVLDDTHWACLHNYSVSLFIRPWIKIMEWQEFRCIIKKRQVCGISQYYIEGRPFYEEINNAPHNIANDLHEFLKIAVLPHSTHANYVCDVLYQKGEVRILDYNPLVSTTGLGFFAPRFPCSTSPEFRFWLGKGIGSVALHR